MNSTDKSSRSKLNPGLLIWGCFSLLALHALAFIFLATAPQIQADLWRHLSTVVIPFMENDAGLSILWSNMHPSPLLHLFQIANMKYFDFRMDYDAYLGLFFKILTTLIILKAVLSTTSGRNQDLGVPGALTVLLLLFMAFGFTTIDPYTWPLVGINQYVYLLTIIIFMLADRCVKQESSINHLWVALASFVLILANFDFGTILLFSIIATTFVIYCVDRRAVYLRTTLTLAAVWLAVFLALKLLIPETPAGHKVSVVDFVTGHYTDFFHFLKVYAIGFSSGLINIRAIRNEFPGAEPLLVGASILVFLSSVAVFITYIRRKLYLVTILPLALMLISVIFTASVLAFRSWSLGDSWYISQARYTPTFLLSVIGLIWGLWLIVEHRTQVLHKPFNATCKRLTSVTLCLLIAIQLLQIGAGWMKVPGIRAKNQSHALGIYLFGHQEENDMWLPLGAASSIQWPEVAAYLAQNDLNVFSSNFPDSPLLDQHVKSRNRFFASNVAMTIGRKDGAYGEVLAKNGSIDATWDMSPRTLLISNDSGQTLYLRVRVRGVYTVFLTLRSSDRATQNVPLFGGMQNLYFQIGRNEKLEITINTRAKLPHIEEFELRTETLAQ